MAEAAEKLPEVDLPFIRRYQSADIQKHAEWLFPRMERAFPHMSRPAHYTWLLDVLMNNDVLPLYHDKGIAFAVVTSPIIGKEARVEELFVWMQDPSDTEQVRAGAHFYSHFYEWAMRRNIQTVIIENNTDISRKAILEATGRRVFEAKRSFMRVRE